jgi:hypothetical protein
MIRIEVISPCAFDSEHTSYIHTRIYMYYYTYTYMYIYMLPFQTENGSPGNSP